MAPRSRWLDLKIPPVLVLAVMALAMSASGLLFPALSIPLHASVRLAAASGIALCGALACLAGVLAFRKAGTTVNPLTPQSVSCFVAGGIYRYSRNPMYLGFLLTLTGLALYLGNALGAIFLILFVLYMNRFQIAPEEDFLAARFGAAYRTYCESVPRWI
jgi:protein-S-isoprenylcysteine O-methyltransferase Ste14